MGQNDKVLIASLTRVKSTKGNRMESAGGMAVAVGVIKQRLRAGGAGVTVRQEGSDIRVYSDPKTYIPADRWNTIKGDLERKNITFSVDLPERRQKNYGLVIEENEQLRKEIVVFGEKANSAERLTVEWKEHAESLSTDVDQRT